MANNDVNKKLLSYLKKPSQVTKNTDLPSPSTFTAKEKCSKGTIKTPSDFLPPKPMLKAEEFDQLALLGLKERQNTNTTRMSKPSSKSVNAKQVSAKSKLLMLPTNFKGAQPQSQELSDGELEMKYKQAKGKIQNLEIKLLEQNKQLEVQVLQHENNLAMLKESWRQTEKRLEEECTALKGKLESVNREHFNEMKNVYDKYMLLQREREEEKDIFTRRSIAQEQRLSNVSSDKIQLDEQFQRCKLKNTELKETLVMQKTSHQDVTAKLHEQIQLLKQNLEHTQIEKDQNIEKLRKFMISVDGLTDRLETKSKLCVELQEKLQIEEKQFEKEQSDNQQQCLEFRTKMQALEKLLNEELSLKIMYEDKLKEKDNQVSSLQKSVAHLQCCVDDLNLEKSDQMKIHEKQMQYRKDELQELQNTCKTLQSTNELLNVRLSSLNEIFNMQESSVGDVVDTCRKDKLLKLWRQKVYSLLVLLKTNEIRECYNNI